MWRGSSNETNHSCVLMQLWLIKSRGSYVLGGQAAYVKHSRGYRRGPGAAGWHGNPLAAYSFQSSPCLKSSPGMTQGHGVNITTSSIGSRLSTDYPTIESVDWDIQL